MKKEIKTYLTTVFLNLAFKFCPNEKFKTEYCVFLINNLNKLYK